MRPQIDCDSAMHVQPHPGVNEQRKEQQWCVPAVYAYYHVCDCVCEWVSECAPLINATAFIILRIYGRAGQANVRRSRKNCLFMHGVLSKLETWAIHAASSRRLTRARCVLIAGCNYWRWIDIAFVLYARSQSRMHFSAETIFGAESIARRGNANCGSRGESEILAAAYVQLFHIKSNDGFAGPGRMEIKASVSVGAAI